MASRSPSPYRSPKAHVRRSPTYSDMSSPRRRSRSRSPVDRRPHRLPTVPPAPTHSAAPSNTEGKKKKKRKKDRGVSLPETRSCLSETDCRDKQRQRQADAEFKDSVAAQAMPPPPAPHSASMAQEPEPMLVERPSKMVYPPPSKVPPQSEPTRISIRSAGFKPIGKPDSALKRFFPGDEDDAETTDVAQPPPQERRPASPVSKPNDKPQQAAAVPPATGIPTPAPAPAPAPPLIPHPTNGHYAQNGYNGQYPQAFVPELGRPQWPLPSPGPVMMNGYPMARYDMPVNPHLPPPAMPGWPHQRPVHTQWLPEPLPVRSVPPPSKAAWPPVPVNAPTVTSSGLPSPVESQQFSPPPQSQAASSKGPSPKQEPPTKEKERDVPPHISKTAVKTHTRKAPPPATAELAAKQERTVETPSKQLYAVLNQVGEGTFGKVYKAQNTSSKVYVALKRIRMETERDGFPVTAMREIKLLQSLKHPNVVRLHEMMVSNGGSSFCK